MKYWRILFFIVCMVLLALCVFASDSTSIHVAYGQTFIADEYYPSIKSPLYTIEKSNDTLFIWLDKSKQMKFSRFGRLGYIYQDYDNVKLIFYIEHEEKIMTK